MTQKRTLDTFTNEQAQERGVQMVGTQQWMTVCKAWNESEGWFVSTKAMELPGLGVLIQTTRKEDGPISESMVFVPGAVLIAKPDYTVVVQAP